MVYFQTLQVKVFASCRGNTMHYLLHGCHHKHPMDGLRLVFPPAAAAILCVPVCSALPDLLIATRTIDESFDS